MLYLSHAKGIMCLVLCSSFLVTHSFGRRMLYPGSVGLLQKAMRPMLQQGQAKLIEEVETTDAQFEIVYMIKHIICWSFSVCFLTVRWSKEQAVGLRRERDWHYVCWPKESRGAEWSDPGKWLQSFVIHCCVFILMSPVTLGLSKKIINPTTGHLLWRERWLLWGWLHEHATGGWAILYLSGGL